MKRAGWTFLSTPRPNPHTPNIPKTLTLFQHPNRIKLFVVIVDSKGYWVLFNDSCVKTIVFRIWVKTVPSRSNISKSYKLEVSQKSLLAGILNNVLQIGILNSAFITNAFDPFLALFENPKWSNTLGMHMEHLDQFRSYTPKI